MHAINQKGYVVTLQALINYVNRAIPREFRMKLAMLRASIVYRAKRHYHLHLVLKKTSVVRDLERHFFLRDQANSEAEVPSIHGTLERSLFGLQKRMTVTKNDPGVSCRPFRGEFVKTVREFRGLSREQLCRLINAHPNLQHLADRHPSLWTQFPYNAEFLRRFEEETDTIFEEITQGFLFGVGFPTGSFAELVAKVCSAESAHVEFRQWYSLNEAQKVLDRSRDWRS